MRQLKTPLKSYYALELLAPNRYELDLSNEVLYIIVGQEGAKIIEIKVGGQKRIGDFFRLPTLTSDIFAAS